MLNTRMAVTQAFWISAVEFAHPAATAPETIRNSTITGAEPVLGILGNITSVKAVPLNWNPSAKKAGAIASEPPKCTGPASASTLVPTLVSNRTLASTTPRAYPGNAAAATLPCAVESVWTPMPLNGGMRFEVLILTNIPPKMVWAPNAPLFIEKQALLVSRRVIRSVAPSLDTEPEGKGGVNKKLNDMLLILLACAHGQHTVYG
jgi:hypothetical protein